jgi:hypothetical protein
MRSRRGQGAANVTKNAIRVVPGIMRYSFAGHEAIELPESGPGSVRGLRRAAWTKNNKDPGADSAMRAHNQLATAENPRLCVKPFTRA